MEAIDLDLVAAVRDAVTIPLAVKLSPYYSALANFARRRSRAPAPTASCCSTASTSRTSTSRRSTSSPRLELSHPWEMRLPMRWIAILRPQLGAGRLAGRVRRRTRGTDVVKALMVGADVVMMTSALLRHGPEHVATVEAELRAWMVEREYESVDQLRGSASQATVEDPGAFERANYMQTLRSWARETAAARSTDPHPVGHRSTRRRRYRDRAIRPARTGRAAVAACRLPGPRSGDTAVGWRPASAEEPVDEQDPRGV